MAMLHAVDGIESDEGVKITTTCNEMPVSIEPSSQSLQPQMLFPALHLTALTMSGPGCIPC